MSHVLWNAFYSHTRASGVQRASLISQPFPRKGQLEMFARAIPGTRLLHGRKVSVAYARSLTSYGSSGRGTACSARKGGHSA